MSARTLSSPAEYQSLVDQYDTWLFECVDALPLLSGSRLRTRASAPSAEPSERADLLLLPTPPHSCARSCDGVIWEGDHVIGKAGDTLQYLRKQGKRIFFVTNNATKSRASNKGKFDKMGIECEVVRPLSHSPSRRDEQADPGHLRAGRDLHVGVRLGGLPQGGSQVPR